MGFSGPLLNLFQIKSVSARPWHTYPLHKFYLFLHNIQPQLKQAWADKLLEKIKPQTSPNNRAGRQCTFFFIQEFYHLNLYGKKSEKNRGAIFFSIRSASFSFFSLFWSTTHTKEAKNENFYLLRYLIATCFIGFLSSRRLI